MKKFALTVCVPLLISTLVSCETQSSANQPAPDAQQQDTYGSDAYYGQQTYPSQNPYAGQGGGYSDVTPAPPPSSYQDQAYNPPPPAAGPQSHIVEQGETLYRISKMYGTTVDGIKSANGLTSDLIHPGQVLSIP